MQLVQKGEVRLNDPVAKYIPEFAQNGKDDVTVRNLLTHYSGLRGDFDLDPPWQGRDAALRLAYAETPVYPPGSRFIYSDTNFITLGALVERVTGTTLDEYCARKIFRPLAHGAHSLSAAGSVAAEDCAHRIRRARQDAARRGA